MPMATIFCTNCNEPFLRKLTPAQSANLGRLFCRPLCKSEWERGRKRINENDYRLRYRYVTRNGKPMGEHRWIKQCELGRELLPDEDVHHVDGNGLNNSLDNLIVVTREDHMHDHHMLDVPINTIKALRIREFNVRRIAREIGCSKNTVTNRLVDMGFDLKRP